MQEFKKNIHGSRKTTLIITNKDMNDMMKMIQALENSNIFLTTIKTLKQLKMKQKSKKEDF